MTIVSCVGIILAIAFVCYLAYIGYSPVVCGPIAAAIICITSGIDLGEGLLTHYSSGFASMVQSMLFTYMSCMLFGHIMVSNKMAFSVADFIDKTISPKYAPCSIVLVCAILCLGGMNMGAYLIAYNIGLVLCPKYNYSEDIILGSIMGGSWTFSNCSPFYLSVANTIASNGLGTSPSAGLIPGLASSIVMFFIICAYLLWQADRWKKKGRVFTAGEYLPDDEGEACYPPVVLSFIPLILVMTLYNLFFCPLPFALIIGSLVATILTANTFNLRDWTKIWEKGALGCVVPLFSLCSMRGIGSMVVLTPAYSYFFSFMQTTNIPPYILTFASVNILAGALGSGSSAVSSTLPVLSPLFDNWVATRGFDMGNFHRLLVGGSVCLDSLPHNGTIAAMCQMFYTTQKKSYYPAIWTTIVIPLLTGIFILVPLCIMGSR